MCPPAGSDGMAGYESWEETMAVNRASPCFERPVKTIETWYPVCLLPVQEITTPLQWTFPPSRGEDNVSVISAQGEKGASLRNSIPFL